MLELVKILRTTGFFQDYGMFDDAELLEWLTIKHEELFEGYAKRFGFIPRFDEIRLLTSDSKKAFNLVTEPPQYDSKPALTPWIEELSKASGKEKIITQIEEWKGSGCIRIECTINGISKSYVHHFSSSHWMRLAYTLIQEISEYIEGTFHLTNCSSPLDIDGGDFGCVRLTEQEKQILENKLNWTLYSFDNLPKRLALLVA